MARTKAQQADQAEAIEDLRTWFHIGDTVFTVRRAPNVYQVVKVHGKEDHYGERVTYHGWTIKRAMGYRWSEVNEGIIADSPSQLVINLSYALWPDGFECIGKYCPSNEHSNGDRDFTTHHHRTGLGALKHDRI